jgi:predicted CXXCH cytochrome family protein
VIAPGYTAGADYYDYFVPGLEFGPRKAQDPTYWADGRPRRFSNDAIGLWQSACFLKGGATCTSCHHDPHVPDIDRNAQLAPSANTLCTKCHEAIGAQVSAHTRHLAGSTGSSCVECHMPKTVISIKATMRDHTISVPAPENTVAFGIPNACTECHADKKPEWAVAALAKWWPDGRRTKLVARARAFTAARDSRPEAIPGLIAIASDESQGPLIRANAAGYLRNYPDARAVAALVAAASASHPAIRAVAISSLGQLGAQTAVPRPTIVAALDDPKRAVRISALVALINLPSERLAPSEEARFRVVAREFAAKARLHQDDAGTQRDLGLIQLLSGDAEAAAEALQISLALEPDRPSATFFLALARLGQHRVEDARSLLKHVSRSDPYYNAAQARLRQLPDR